MLLNKRNTFYCVDSKGCGLCEGKRLEEDNLMGLLMREELPWKKTTIFRLGLTQEAEK